jgi:hypothetical protein
MVARIYDEYRRLLRPASAALPLDAGVPCPATRETAAETAPSAAGIR